MNEFKYEIVGVIAGQEYRSKNNTREEFENIRKMIYAAGGWIVEYIEEEVM